MRLLLFIGAAICGVFALFLSTLASNAAYQIYGAMFWVISALLLVGAAIVDAVMSGASRIEKAVRDSTVRMETCLARPAKPEA